MSHQARRFGASAFRVVALLLASLLCFGGLAWADTTATDTDTATTGNQNDRAVSLAAETGEDVQFSADIYIECNSNSHMGTSTTFVYDSANSTVPAGGALTATSATISRPGTWPADGSNCNSAPASPKGTSTVTVTAPSTADTYEFIVTWKDDPDDPDVNVAPGQVKVTITLTVTEPVPSDGTPPEISYVIAGTPGSNGWYTSDVSVTWSVTDAESTPVIDSGCGVQNFTAETTGVASSCTAHSDGGSASQSVNIKLDKTGPTAALSVTAGTAGLNGWYTTDVTVDTSGSDSISGPVVCTADQFQTAETTGTVFNGSCTNDAGLSTNAAPLTVKLDKTGPTAALSVTAGTLGSNGWYTSDVTIHTSGSDSISSPVGCTADQYQTVDTTGTVFNGSCTNDAGLSTNAAPLTIKLDKTGPSAALVVTAGTAGLNGWYTSDVTIDTQGSDDSPVTCTADQYQTAETTGTVFNGSCTNEAGLTTNADPLTIKLDKTAPTANLAVTAGTGGLNGWYISDVTVETSGTDISPVVCTGPQYQTTETAGTVFNGSCTNEAGLSANASPLTVKLDKTGPSANLAVTAGTAGTAGWYTSDVTVDTSGSDSISGPVVCTPDQFQTAETTGTVFNGSCTNDAGLTTDATPLTVKLDKTGPTAGLTVTAGTAGLNGWYTSDVTVSTSGSDSISTPVVCTPAQFQTAETTGTAFNGSCTNDAGLTTNAAPFTVKLDKTGPTAGLAVIAGTLGSNGWYTSDVTVGTSGSDSISSPVACSPDQFQTAETTGTVFNGSCTNDAGLTTNASPLTVKLDKTAPTAALSVSAGTLGSNGWYTSDVTIGTSGSDSISSPVVCTADQFQTAETTGTIFNGSCTNDAGLTTNASPLTVMLDKSAPVLNVSGPVAGYWDICTAGAPARPTFAPADGISLLDGSEYDTWATPGTPSGVGTYTYYAWARNNAGLPNEETRVYTVSYGAGAFSGILQPINADGSSRFRLGSTIPVKFRLTCGATPITNAVAELQVSQVDAKPDPGESEAVSTAASTTGNLFRYDATGQQYIFNLSTKLGFTNEGSDTAIQFSPGTWYLWITLDDGSYYKVKVNLTK